MIGQHPTVRARAFCWSCEKRASSPVMSPPRTVCFDIFSPLAGDNDAISQLVRLSSSETKIAPRLVRMAVGASSWSAAVSMIVSRAVGSVNNSTLSASRSPSTRPWDLVLVGPALLAGMIGAVVIDEVGRIRHEQDRLLVVHD